MNTLAAQNLHLLLLWFLMLSWTAFSKAIHNESVIQLSDNNFLLGIAQLAVLRSTDFNKSQCDHELGEFLAANAKNAPWSIKVLDSFGHAPRSFVWGDYFWFSARELCEDLNSPFEMSLLNATNVSKMNMSSPFPVQFSVVYMRFTSPYYINWKLPYEDLIHVGLCLPKSCDEHTLLNLTQTYFAGRHFKAQQALQLELNSIGSKIPQFHWSLLLHHSTLMFIACCLICISLIILAEIHQQSMFLLTWKSKQKVNIEKMSQLIECFNIRTNLKIAMELEGSKKGKPFLGVIAGMRTIICLWVTIFHVYYYSLFAVDNVTMIFAKLENFALQPILQACFYVDVFFVISSFLVVYHFLANKAQMQIIKENDLLNNVKYFLSCIFQRYMRLAPVMIITLLLGDFIYDLLNMVTPFHLGPNSGLYCKQNWWQNLIFIHNFLDMNDICCSWTWYLGCEMQFFLLLTLILMIYARNANVAKTIFIILTTAFVIISWCCNYYNGITFHIDNVYSTLNELYVKPWVRINPYIGGAILGWVFYGCQQRLLTDNIQTSRVVHEWWQGRVATKVFWLFCVALYILTNFMSYWRSSPVWLVATIMSIGKLIFSLVIGTVILLCSFGFGIYLNKLLGAKIFLYLEKFCYSIYMIAPIIVYFVFGLRREPTRFSEIGSGMDFIAIMVIAICAAFLLFVLVELPMQRLSKVLLKDIFKCQSRPDNNKTFNHAVKETCH